MLQKEGRDVRAARARPHADDEPDARAEEKRAVEDVEEEVSARERRAVRRDVSRIDGVKEGQKGGIEEGARERRPEKALSEQDGAQEKERDVRRIHGDDARVFEIPDLFDEDADARRAAHDEPARHDEKGARRRRDGVPEDDEKPAQDGLSDLVARRFAEDGLHALHGLIPHSLCEYTHYSSFFLRKQVLLAHAQAARAYNETGTNSRKHINEVSYVQFLPFIPGFGEMLFFLHAGAFQPVCRARRDDG